MKTSAATANHSPKLHRDPAADRARRLETRGRIRKLKKLYVSSKIDKDLDAEIDELIDGMLEVTEDMGDLEDTQLGRLSEGRALVLHGASGVGKSSTLYRALPRRPEFAGFSRSPENTSQVIAVTMPSPATLRLLGIELAKALGYPVVRDLKENVVWDTVRKLLREREVRFIVIDEVQHLTASRSSVEIAKVRDTFKSLLQQSGWPVWLILVGLDEVAALVESDIQLRRRSRFLRIEPLSLERDAKRISAAIKQYAEHAGVGCERVITDEVISRLIHASTNAMGILLETLIGTMKVALLAGDTELTVDHFAAHFRRTTGCMADNNVFHAPGDFTTIDVSRLLSGEYEQEAPRKVRA